MTDVQGGETIPTAKPYERNTDLEVEEVPER
ncbi:hypothetical protein HALLA_00175 (plasmid) [Halostagnicola larsenii XH-48]|uniref:Uncharacterized protein n=1 Tax=Halostagnicola larsenii XH-48 TaxID=797299 RepID=W0JT25_9EURY|nr:hypothetical protein HALLA_00175 [Halostagnicola larsenii XH-48]